MSPPGDPRPPKLRLFVAVEVPDSVRAELEEAVAPLRAEVPGLRWTSIEGWHLTAAFLGAVEPGLLPQVETAVGRAAAGSTPFSLRLTGEAGTFPGGVLWAGVAPAPLLDELAASLRVRFAALGRPPDERPFHAHLTLARSGRGSRLPDDLVERYAGPSSPWTVRTLALMRSRLAVGGARYEVWREYSLGEAFDPPHLPTDRTSVR